MTNDPDDSNDILVGRAKLYSHEQGTRLVPTQEQKQKKNISNEARAEGKPVITCIQEGTGQFVASTLSL